MNTNETYCGFISIIGRPNVGKSTLLNKLIRKKISITSRKKKTTDHYIIGVHTTGKFQAIYIDTPGNDTRCMTDNLTIVQSTVNQLENNCIENIALIIFVIDTMHWFQDDETILRYLRKQQSKVILVVNKVDRIKEKVKLLPYLKFLEKKMNFLDIIPISAKVGININSLEESVLQSLPKSAHKFSESYVHSYSHRFIAAEIIREKVMRFLGSELPYSMFVKIEHLFINQRGIYDIRGLIFVPLDRQKKIVIGKNGTKIKTISIHARQDIQKALSSLVYLKLWVKTIRSNINDTHILHHNITLNS